MKGKVCPAISGPTTSAFGVTVNVWPAEMAIVVGVPLVNVKVSPGGVTRSVPANPTVEENPSATNASVSVKVLDPVNLPLLTTAKVPIWSVPVAEPPSGTSMDAENASSVIVSPRKEKVDAPACQLIMPAFVVPAAARMRRTEALAMVRRFMIDPPVECVHPTAGGRTGIVLTVDSIWHGSRDSTLGRLRRRGAG